jgi:hypothetical protein
MNKINLKDLVWKEIDPKIELSILEEKWAIASDSNRDFGYYKFYFDNAEQIAKEKAEILNKKIEYTKQDIFDIFVKAGFEQQNDSRCVYKIKQYTFYVYFSYVFEIVGFELNDGQHMVQNYSKKFFDRKAIEFYYKKIREILEFEVSND